MRRRLAIILLTLAVSGCARIDEETSSQPPPQGFAGYKVAVLPGETLDQLAQRFEVSPDAIIQANHLQPPYGVAAHQVVIIPPPPTYRVRSGDTVAGIATMLGVDEIQLAHANGLQPPYQMQVGQVLHVPGGIGGDGGTMAADSGGLPVAAPVARSAISASALPPPPGSAAAPGSAPAMAAPVPAAAPLPVPTTAPPARVAANSPTALAPPSAQPRIAIAAPLPVVAAPAAPPGPAPAPAATQAAVAAAPAPAAVAPTATPVAVPAAAPHFMTPVKGDVIGRFGPDASGQKNDGINIAAAAGTPVGAAEAGTVIYAGNELPAFGNLVMVRHAGGWVTAYGHLASIAVQRGATVTRGETLGTVGQTGSVSSPQLHFEIRQGSQPVDPAPYLAAKS